MNKQPKLVIDKNGSKNWLLGGKYHREDGPAFETSEGYKQWYINGEKHRVDGPAVIYPDGGKYWYLNDRMYSYEEWFKRLTSEQQYNYLWNLDE
jgi:hypothetical protein